MKNAEADGGEEDASVDDGIRGESHSHLGVEGGYTPQRSDDDGFEDSIVITKGNEFGQND